MKNILLSIVDIAIKVATRRNYEENTSFMLWQNKKINKKKNKPLNKRHNKRTKHYNSRERMQYDINNSRFENKN